MEAKVGRVRVVRCAPKRFPCPSCGQKGRRKGYLPPRWVLDLEPGGGLCTIELRTAEYRARCECCKTFRSHPPVDFPVEPGARYSNRIRDLVIHRLLEDNLSVERLIRSLRRDFRLSISEGFVYQCLDWKVRQVQFDQYRRWTLERFSGVLCVDELHLGHRTLLIATDPIADLVVSFAIVSQNDQDHMRGFLGNLKAHGFRPKVVVTDGSGLYPALLKELWPMAQHQLCVFHLLKEVNEDILDAVRRYRKEAWPKPLRKKGKRGRPKKDQAEARRRTREQEQRSKFVWDHRYLVVTSPENLGEQDETNLAVMFEYLPALKRLRAFALEVREALDPRWTRRQAWSRFRQLQGKAEYQDEEELGRALHKLRREKFAKVITALDWTSRTRIRTNNHVERQNRVIRLKEKVRYGWRKRRTLVRFIVLSLDNRWQKRKDSKDPPKRIKRRAKRKIRA